MDNNIMGIGVNTKQYPSYDGKNILREYNLWSGILSRCTKAFWEKKPSYAGVTCSDNFKSYSYFYEWCQEQVGFNNKDENGKSWHLDKDLLIKGNRVYSEDTCIFIPQRINKLLVKQLPRRGVYPIGVNWHITCDKFSSRCKDGHGKTKSLGCHDTEQEAFLAYKTFKEVLIKQTAENYKDKLDYRAYQALIAYKVNQLD